VSGVLVTHADEPLGRRVVKTLYHEEPVQRILAVGEGPPPRAFDRFLADSEKRLSYVRADVAKHRPVSDLFHSPAMREMGIDTVVHLPRHGAAPGDDRPVVSGLPARTAEARLILQHSLEVRAVRSLIAVGSAYVYRLQPGNANRLREESELDLAPDVSPELRSWIDCDMIFHGEVGADRLRVVLLRVPTVVATGGYVYLNPHLAGRAGLRLRPAGFDPMCPLVCDKDVARAVRAAVASERAGIYNVAGVESLPLSVLSRWTNRPALPVPGPVLYGAGTLLRWLGADAARARVDGTHLRFGFTLDTAKAERELDFVPAYRIGLSRAGDGRVRLETSAA
jgi:nucleoside-diphosphate-sugar epimerase